MAIDKSTAETIVKVWAVLSWIGALLSVIGGLIFIGLGGLGGLGGMMGGGMMDGGLFAGFGVIIGVVFIALGVFYAIAGFGLWSHKPWARIVTLVLSVISLFSFPLGTIIGALGIWLFGFEENVKALFA